MTSEANHTRQRDIQPVHQTKRQTCQFYDRIAPFYDLLSERTEGPVRQRALAMLAAHSGERLLEIGPGTGHNLVELARAVGARGQVYGIDLSAAMLARARSLTARSGLEARVTLTCGDATHLPYSDSTMDGVLMTFTLELFDTPEIPVVLSECRRVLRPDGRIVVAGLTKEADAGAVLRALEWTHLHLPQIFDCRPIYVRQALTDAGFTIAEVAMAHAWVPVEVVLGTVSHESRVTGGRIAGNGQRAHQAGAAESESTKRRT
jgi:ubiquinone/menaquinone biosynthesis C-methylase UbiE